jgi:hypothetical protein
MALLAASEAKILLLALLSGALIESAEARVVGNLLRRQGWHRWHVWKVGSM